MSQLSLLSPDLKDYKSTSHSTQSEQINYKNWSLADRKANLLTMVDELPQRDAIDMSDARSWVDQIFLVDPDRAEWHMTRASGVGGSEIGGLVRNYMGYRANFEFSAHDWAREKLLKDLPVPTTGHMMRGIQNERAHAERFYRETGAKRDKEAFKLLSNHKGSLRWMRYSPDDVVNMPASAAFGIEKAGDKPIKGKVLVDYKAPNVIDDSEEISFQYACQLHQGAILLDELGIQLSGILLSQYDWANWRLKNDVIPISSDLKSIIIETGNHYWDCVLRGEIPNYIRKPMLEMSPETLEAHSKLAEKYQLIAAIQSELDKMVKETRGQIVSSLNLDETRFGSSKLKFNSGLSITASPKFDDAKARELLTPEQAARCISTKKTTAAPTYDIDAMFQKFVELNIDPAQFVIRPLDAEAVYSELEQAGIDPELIVTEQMRFTVSKPVKEQAKAWVDENFRQSDESAEQQETTALPPDEQPGNPEDSTQVVQRMRAAG